MSVPFSGLPLTPLNGAVQPVLASAVLTSAVTLTAPTSDTYVTGLTLSVVIPQDAQFVAVYVQGKGATVTAGSTVTLSAYTGATAGTLTTKFADYQDVIGTGATTEKVNGIFWLPVTPSLAGTTVQVSIAASASTGNFVLNAAATEPTTIVAVCL